MIKITKQLQRPDGGTVSANSIIDYETQFSGINEKKVLFQLRHHFSQTAKDENKTLIPMVTNFDYSLLKQCSDEEWEEVFSNAGAGDLAESWLQELIEEKIGAGNTMII